MKATLDKKIDSLPPVEKRKEKGVYALSLLELMFTDVP